MCLYGSHVPGEGFLLGFTFPLTSNFGTPHVWPLRSKTLKYTCTRTLLIEHVAHMYMYMCVCVFVGSCLATKGQFAGYGKGVGHIVK